MRIKFKAVSASAKGVFGVGDVAEFDKDFAKPLVDAGYAELVEEKPEAEPAEEKPAPKKKGKKVE